MSHDIENAEVYLAAQSRGGMNFYGDEASLGLTDRYDPLTYKGKRCSEYMDATLEMVASPFAVIGYVYGRYFGLDREGLDQAIVELECMPMRVGNEPSELVPDFRITTYEDTRIYFPTGNLLEAFGVQLVQSSTQQVTA